MEATISQVRTVAYICSSSSSPVIKSKNGLIPCPIKDGHVYVKERILRNGKVLKMKCSSNGDTVPEESDQLLNMEKELIGMKKLNEKCKEIGGGIIELVECLEREAIMGDDKGKEPTDYNRRAQIFDKSSRVFKALKQTNSNN